MYGFHTTISYYHPVSPPPPDDINWTFTGPNQIQFEWNSIAYQCLTVHYVIIATNCGSCQNSTTFTNATCTYNVPTEDIPCSFAIKTVICETITGKISDPLYVRLKGNIIIYRRIISIHAMLTSQCSTLTLPGEVQLSSSRVIVAVVFSCIDMLLAVAALSVIAGLVLKEKIKPKQEATLDTDHTRQ